jgi:hypothetical protein
MAHLSIPILVNICELRSNSPGHEVAHILANGSATGQACRPRDGALIFNHHDLAPGQCQRPCHGQAHYPCADDDDIELVRGLATKPLYLLGTVDHVDRVHAQFGTGVAAVQHEHGGQA